MTLSILQVFTLLSSTFRDKRPEVLEETGLITGRVVRYRLLENDGAVAVVLRPKEQSLRKTGREVTPFYAVLH